MAYASNPVDGTRIHFEDDGAGGADGIPVVLCGGILDSVADQRESALARGLAEVEYRRIFVDHRGLGGSDKPHDTAAYAMVRRVGDAVAVLDKLSIERAHFIGLSWGGRLVFGIAEHAPDRVASIVSIGQQPYAWPDSPITRAVSEGLEAGRTAGAAGLVEALERFWGVTFPPATRDRWLRNDVEAIAAAWPTVINEGPISKDLRRWRVPCLICIGAGDADFIDGARRAAAEIPGARFVALAGDHYQAHVSADEVLLDAVLETLRAASERATEDDR